MKYILLCVLFLNGCGETDIVWGDVPFIEMEQETIFLREHIELCGVEPDSFLCENSFSIGNEKPTYAYALGVLRIMNRNFTYIADDTWHYNQTVSEYLRGDCEDIASTMAMHMINDGIGKEWLYLVYQKTSDTTAHMFLAVDTYDAGLIHLDYSNSGYPIAEQINFHLPLNNVPIWIKGNI